MRKLLTLSALLSFILFSTSCVDDGPPGPRGPEGPAGAAGETGYVFEYENINFVAPEFSYRLDFPIDFEGLDSDVGLVYLLWDVVDGVEVWRPLPMDEFFEDGILQFNYDYTKYYVDLYIEGTIDPYSLDASWTDEWVARVVIVPGEFWNTSKIDFSDYYTVKEALGLPEITKERKTIIR